MIVPLPEAGRRLVAGTMLLLASVGCTGRRHEPEPPVPAAPKAAVAHDYRIVYSAQVGDGSALFGLDLDSGSSARLTPTMAFAGYPVWSPTGDRLVFLAQDARGSGLLSLDAMTGSVELLIDGMSEPVDFSPDAHLLLLTRDLPDGGRGLFQHEIAGGAEEQIETGSNMDAYARWSRAGNVIAFESGRDDNPEIYRLDLDTGTRSRLTNNPDLDEWPSISPDGDWIAWASGTESSKHLWVMRSDGSEKRQLTDGPLFGDAYPEWSPDSTRILLTGSTPENSVLQLVDVATGTLTAVGNGAAATWR